MAVVVAKIAVVVAKIAVAVFYCYRYDVAD
jgi:hypothetical protein